ncbi:MAG: MATE family efflux transporter [Timaviella obliquedivisa GSE-PSE-MK23-08B]|jgi:MATE family multidrug resistance protein|nr:MATE family efflux transporter [Timaviella obliquedivisa GSE-PSE-MK23-08B]
MFESRSFLRQFSQLAIVNILSNLMVPLAGLLDVAFLGHLADIHHLAGVALATILVNYLYWTFGFLRMGTTGLTAQAVGRNDSDTVLLIGLRNGGLALGIGLLILMMQQPLGQIGFSMLSANENVKASGMAYYQALIWGAPATLLNYVLIGWFLGRGQSGKVLLLSAVGNGAKVLLDYLLIVQWGWLSRGAGYATAWSQVLMMAIGLFLLVWEFRSKPLALGWKELLDPTALKSALWLNSEILVRSFALISTFALFTNLSSVSGTEVLTVNAVLLEVVTFAAFFIDGLAFATESWAGVLHGQGTTDGLVRLLKVSGVASLLLGVSVAIAFIVAPVPLFSLLTNHTNVIIGIQKYVVWLLPILGLGSIAYLLDGYFLGLTSGRILRNAAIMALLIGFAPMAAIAFYYHSNHLLWLSLALFMGVRVVTLGTQVPRTLHPANASVSD